MAKSRALVYRSQRFVWSLEVWLGLFHRPSPQTNMVQNRLNFQTSQKRNLAAFFHNQAPIICWHCCLPFTRDEGAFWHSHKFRIMTSGLFRNPYTVSFAQHPTVPPLRLRRSPSGLRHVRVFAKKAGKEQKIQNIEKVLRDTFCGILNRKNRIVNASRFHPWNQKLFLIPFLFINLW